MWLISFLTMIPRIKSSAVEVGFQHTQRKADEEKSRNFNGERKKFENTLS